MGEDLRYWRPKEYTEYNGWNRRHSKAYVVIYFRNKKGDDSLEEHYGGFDILGDKVKIWYMQNGQKLQRFVPRSICEFSKTMSGHTTYYHLIIGTKNDENMAKEKDDEKSGYGLEDREGTPEEKSVIFRVPKEKVGVFGRLTGRTSAIYLKKKYEDKLNELWEEFDTTIEEIKKKNTEFDKLDTSIPGLKKTLSVIETEWRESLTSLGNILEKNKRHEWEMWNTTQKSRQIRVQKNAPKIKYSDVDEMNFNSMTDFIKQYPELQSQKTIDKATQDVEEKRKELINAQKELDKAISERNLIVSTFEKLTDKAQKNLDEFEDIIKEAEEKVNSSPYNKSKLWRALKTEYEKEATKLDLMQYRGKLEERKSVLERVKGQHAKYQRKEFVDMEH
jgi:hypothetical protein